MRFLVSTTHDILAVDPEKCGILRVHSGRGLYFGLASDAQNHIFVACRNATQGPIDASIRATEQGSVLVFDSSFRLCEELLPPFPMRDVHGIALFDEKLWVTCSFDNMIAVYDRHSRTWSHWYPDPSETDRDVHHFNTICFMGNELWLVAHRFGASELMVYDYPGLSLKSVIPLGRMAHNVFYFHGSLAVCSSEEGSLINVKGERLHIGEFPRGVAITDSGNLVGISMNAPRLERAEQDARLRWFTKDWQARADFLLKGAGMVLEILAVEEENYTWSELEPWPHWAVSQSGIMRS